MRSSLPTIVRMALLLAATGATAYGQSSQCTLEFIDEPVLAAAEAGIIEIVKPEGEELQEGDTVAATDATDAELQREASYFQLQATLKEIESEVRLLYAEKNHLVAKAAYRQVLEANNRQPRAISQAELDRRKFEEEAAELQIKNEIHDRAVAKITAMAEEAAYKRATEAVKRHKIRSPINGMVTERFKKPGEFVQAGEQVVRVARLDRLRATAAFQFADMPRSQAKGRMVTITIPIGKDAAGNNVVRTVNGTISYVPPDVMSDDTYTVWVEIDNPNGEFLPGMNGQMTLN